MKAQIESVIREANDRGVSAGDDYCGRAHGALALLALAACESVFVPHHEAVDGVGS